MKLLFLPISLAILAHAQEPPARVPISAEELCIAVKGASREVAFTNKRGGVFYTETNARHRSSWQGWRVMSRKIMEDYVVELDGRELSRSAVVRANVFPHQLAREYSNGVRETLTMVDSVDALVIQLDSVRSNNIAIRPLFSDLHTEDDFTLRASLGALMIGRNDQAGVAPGGGKYPRWIALSIMPMTDFALSIYEGKAYGRNYAPAVLRSGIKGDHYAFVLAAGDDSIETAYKVSRIVLGWSKDDPTISRRRRIVRTLNDSFIRTDDPRLNKALGWARASLDALIMNQRKPGIFAGLPWFDDYWGRDSFISLPGATLVTGNFADARNILRSFAEWQDTVTSSPTYGRIPNRVTTASISYNSADGTPRFVAALGEYVRYSGDTAFAREMYPVVRRSIEGTLKYHADKNYFLTHGDADTWMDAAGPKGSWSPRGNRGNDVQALWYSQLGEGIGIAKLASGGGGDRASIGRWSAIRDTLASNFNRYFLPPGGGPVYDHLQPDGSPEKSNRPNQLFTADLIKEPNARLRMFESVTRRLVYHHGVATLSQDDEGFHPFHNNAPYYVPDEAYHNGIVWPWLAGRWIDLAAAYGLQDSAFEVTQNYVHQLLDRGAVGTLPELIDAAPRPGKSEPDLSGAYSQAWSLAEFIRSFYQAYLGVGVDALHSSITLRPRLPSSVHHADFNVRVGPATVAVAYERRADGIGVTLSSPPGARNLEIRIVSPPEFGTARRGSARDGTASDNLLLQESSVQLASGTRLKLVIARNGIAVEGGQATLVLGWADTLVTPNPAVFAGLRLATPVIHPGLKALHPPPYKILSGAEIKANDGAANVLYEAADPEGDDKGPGGYAYPLTSSLKPGSLDLVHFTVSSGGSGIHFKLQFRNLSDPGWHPEYGFQLTYAAIAIDKGGTRGSGQRNVGMNARYSFSPGFEYESIIYIGGGIEVQDSKGDILAEYLPAPSDAGNPLGDAASKTIEFTIPAELLGTPQADWRYAVLVGAQEDHGGAGIGEFRNVEAKASEWAGGGKKSPRGSNVYDELLPKKSR